LPRSYWYQPGGQPHHDKCEGPEPCIALVVMEEALDFAPSDAKSTDSGGYVLSRFEDVELGPMVPDQPDGAQFAVVHTDPKSGSSPITSSYRLAVARRFTATSRDTTRSH